MIIIFRRNEIRYLRRRESAKKAKPLATSTIATANASPRLPFDPDWVLDADVKEEEREEAVNGMVEERVVSVVEPDGEVNMVELDDDVEVELADDEAEEEEVLVVVAVGAITETIPLWPSWLDT